MNLYDVDAQYCRYLRQFDEKVPYNEGAKKRPFIGIVITIHAVDFFAPLTSPKQKHDKMRNQIDFIKMDHGRLGAINLNNMIPVAEDLFEVVNMEGSIRDTIAVRDYKQLLRRQSAWCNLHQSMILHAAVNLYMQVIKNEAPIAIQSRCCDFSRDMLLLKEYCQLTHHRTNSIVQDIDAHLQWLTLPSYRADHYQIYIR